MYACVHMNIYTGDKINGITSQFVQLEWPCCYTCFKCIATSCDASLK